MTTLQAVELGVLGPLQVRRDGAPVAIPGAKPRAILTMLGLHSGAVVSADTLLELLWGDDSPRTAAKALQTHISSLRRTLGDGFVLTEGAGWTLADTEVDASRYKAAARLGRDAATAGDTSQAVARFEEALTLWRGIPELPDGQRGSSEKTRWIEIHAALVEDRADALLATGRAAEIIGELEAAVADAPLRERRWGQLMVALYRAGRQGEALGAYQRARSLLADQLGVAPGPDLRRLEAAIVAQDAALDMPVAQHVSTVTRAVTFLLTDIEGSTEAWEADAEAMAAALARHDELVEQVVTSGGGRLIKTRGEGDATFSVFERPSAAAAAAIELQEAIAHEPWALREPMRVRVALHTGEVELRDGDYFGRAVNRAARLRSLASGGQILCSGATAELVIDSLADDVVLADLGTRQLRNLARPEHVFELRLQTDDDRPEEVATDEPMERPELPAALTGPGPFVGRGRELEQLSSAWQTALSGGMRALLIAGEPGVGKTRLAGEWSRLAYEQGAVVLYGRCDEDLGAPYQPFAEALRSLVPCLGEGRLRGLRGAEALLSLVPGLTDVLPDLAAPTHADPDTERYALFDAVVALLQVASAGTPVVLVLDDLHWAAKPTLLLLRHLLRFGEQTRVQIVGTYRSTDLDRSHPLAAMLADLHRDGTADRLQLGGLDEHDVTTYVAEAGYDDEELARALASVTGGNPFFLIEALRHVDESGGAWDQSTLPQGVREAVSRRLSRLPVETNKALAAAAVVGSRFAVELVERVVDQDLVDAFDEACKAGIVIEEPGGHYRFNHALVRQSLLAELPSVRRMRLHQRIATTLEAMPGGDDELLAELAHHYFECAWAGNAAKAVEYCRRAADQAMARLAYEGAADLYDRALHALEELDEELSDREDQTIDLLVARCEALLAAGDVASAAGVVAQLQQATRGSARLAAWATCFDGQLSMLIHPERLDEIEAAVGAAADRLAELDDAAGEAKAHTVRAVCLARLGRIGDCEVALDHALTAARRARESRRVNAVLAAAPLAALWGPNPVPRAGGRCLDVVRLLRITTESPAVEATSTRCQAVLEAFRGRAAAGRRMIDSARRTIAELGLRHALLEVEQFAGIVELVADDPAAAEPHLRLAYKGFRRMGLDADTAETAALLGRTCLALDRDAEADELCAESERLAGHALKASIAWRTLRAQLLSRGGEHDEARRLAEAAVAMAESTDILVDHGDACLALATVLRAAGDVAGARAAAEQAVGLYERKGAAALAETARGILGDREIPTPPTPPEAPAVQLDNACVRVLRRGESAVERRAWDEVEQLFATDMAVESRRKMVHFTRDDLPSGDWPQITRNLVENDAMRFRIAVLAVRGERLALTRLENGTADISPGAPQDELLQLFGLDEDGRIALQISFDIDDMDAALAELDAAHARFEAEPGRGLSAELDNACVRRINQLADTFNREAWSDVEQLFASDVVVESRRKIVRWKLDDLPSGHWPTELRRLGEMGGIRHRNTIVATRGERLALIRTQVDTPDVSANAPMDESLLLYGLDEDGRIALQVFFDVEDLETAMAEVDAAHARFEAEQPRTRRLENAASRVCERFQAYLATSDWAAMTDALAENSSIDDRRRVVRAGITSGRDVQIANMRSGWDIGYGIVTSKVIATRGERLILSLVSLSGDDQRPEPFQTEMLRVFEINADERITARVLFDRDEIDAAFDDLDARYLAGEAAAHPQSWSAAASGVTATNRHEVPPATPDFVIVDHQPQHTTTGTTGLTEYLQASWDLTPGFRVYIEAVHQLSDVGAVIALVVHGTLDGGGDAEWRIAELVTHEGGLSNRCEMFDERDLDKALARFDELSTPTRQLENAASRVVDQYLAHFATRDWDVMVEMLAVDISNDERRRVVNAGVRRGRDSEIANVKIIAGLGCTNISSAPIATRGERLVLARHSFTGDARHQSFRSEMIDVVEINDDNQIATHVVFDTDDIDAAFEEIDARYLAGEAAAHASTWSATTAAFAAINRHELPLATPDYVIVDHQLQHTTTDASGLTEYLSASWELTPGLRMYIEQVHQLSELGVVITLVAHGTSPEGLDVDWRMVQVLTAKGGVGDRCEVFNERDLDKALARFEELSSPPRQLENAASQAYDHFWACYEDRDWKAVASTLAEGHTTDDRRRVIGSGARHGREAMISDLQVTATKFGPMGMTSVVIATRGTHLALIHARYSGRDQRPESFHTDALTIVEIDADERIAAFVLIDPDDIETAFEELEARYLVGEAAPHAQTWLVITRGHAAVNRRELPPITPDCVNIDHRRGAAFAPGELAAYLQAGSDLNHNVRTHVEVVHRLTALGAVCTHVGHGVSGEGFDAEWRGVDLVTVEGDMVNRCEVFEESDLDAVLARFDELSRPAHELENSASQVAERFWGDFVARDWEAMSQLLADDVSSQDRRRVVSAGSQHGRAFDIANMRATAEIGVKNASLTVIATRGERLALSRVRLSGRDQRPEAFHTEALGIAEIDADGRLVAHVAFDPDDFTAAIAELDTRYIAGEAAAHARTWAVIAEGYAALNRYEMPAIAPDFADIDHRRVTRVSSGDLEAYISSTDDLTNMTVYMESVHRLTDFGAVVSHIATGTSPDGFDAEWRMVIVFTVNSDVVNRCELFDEADVDGALARFDELSQETQLPINSASQVYERFWAYFMAREWGALSGILHDAVSIDDRRPVVNYGLLRGPASVIDSLKAAPDLGVAHIAQTVLATRGDRLALVHTRFSSQDDRSEAVETELLNVIEIDADSRIVAQIVSDPADIEAALAELDSRYLAGEGAAHARTWSVISGGYAALNRHELLGTPDFVSIDHRRGRAFAPGGLPAYLRATWELTQQGMIYVEAVHRLTGMGAVVTQASYGTSKEGFDAEWREIAVVTIDGELVNRSELFDEVDIDTALARFDELSPPSPQLENAASQAAERFKAYFAADDWDAMAEATADDFSSDDRRQVVGAGVRQGPEAHMTDMQALAELWSNATSTVVATRGQRLVLIRVQFLNRGKGTEAFLTEVLSIIEIDADGRMAAVVSFDPNDIDAAFDELDGRYLVGEATPYAHTWSTVAKSNAAFRHGESAPTTPDCVYVDHRLVRTPLDADTMDANVRAAWDLTPRLSVRIAAVHRLTSLGAVITHIAEGTSKDGFDAEWRDIILLTLDGDLIDRCELFGEADLDAALARFDELHSQKTQLENVASRVDGRLIDCYADRDWAGVVELLADAYEGGDRRRVVNIGRRQGRDAALAQMQTMADLGVSFVAPDVIAVRGDRLVLSRGGWSGPDQRSDAFHTAALTIVEIDTEERIIARVMFDLDDIDAAFDELERRYLAGEAARYSAMWSVISQGYAALNRHELAPSMSDWVIIDHQVRETFAGGDLNAYARSSWDLMPDVRNRIEKVHRLSNLGAVVTHMASGSTQDGFEAEWRMIVLLAVRDGMLNRGELFNETDLATALARFDELQTQGPRLEDAVSRIVKRFELSFAARDWAAMADLFAADYYNDDRRRVVNAGVRRGRGAAIEDLRVAAEVGLLTNIAVVVIATRGSRLILTRFGASGPDHPAIHLDVLQVIEYGADERIAAAVVFDSDDIAAAFAELDTRYLAGEAAVHANTWSALTGAYAAVNRRELPTTTPNWVGVDHRPLQRIEHNDLDTYLRATWDLTPDISFHIEAVHGLSDVGCVVTRVASGTSQAGFGVEWRQLDVFTFDGDKVSRLEVFDEAELEAAIARFDELNRQKPRLENAASQLGQRFWGCFAARDWDAIAAIAADDICIDDRRRVVNAGVQRGRDAHLADMRAIAEVVGAQDITPTVIATRGMYLALTRVRSSHSGLEGFEVSAEVLCLVETNADSRIAAYVGFDVDDLDRAFTELDARYAAGEAADHRHTWSVVAGIYAKFNRRELPTPTADSVSVDHRPVVTVDVDVMAANVGAVLEQMPNLTTSIEAVHRLTDLGAVVSHTARGTSVEGFDAEWRMIFIYTVDGDLVSRYEIFDEADLDAALARFDELQAQKPRLENAAIRSWDRMVDAYNRRDRDGFLSGITVDGRLEDRRKGLRAVFGGPERRKSVHELFKAPDSWLLNSEPIAIRGSRLSLIRLCLRDTSEVDQPITVEQVTVLEVSDGDLLRDTVAFDPEDIDAAFEELESRYAAGEAADHAQTWSVITTAQVALCHRHELPPTTPDWVNLDHRRGIGFAPGDMTAYIRALWDNERDVTTYIEAVHRLSDVGVVFVQVLRGSSADGFDAEWRLVELMTVEGDLVSRAELFDEADLDTALARFDEISGPTS